MRRYIANKVDEIGAMLISIHPPENITRAPRGLKERKFWKGGCAVFLFLCIMIFLYTATEYKSFILYYPLVIFGILPDDLMTHVLLLSKAMRILLGDRLCSSRC